MQIKSTLNYLDGRTYELTYQDADSFEAVPGHGIRVVIEGKDVLVVLDDNGHRLHTQDTWYLELDKGYDPEKVGRFLLSWNRAAVDPTSFR